MFVRQIQQESGFNPDAFNAGSGATGIAQIVRRWHPDVDPTDPIASLDYAATWLVKLHGHYGTYRKALAAYNWGPGNLADWDGQRDTLPAETRLYLDVILGDGWPEPPAIGAARTSLGNQEVRPNTGATNDRGAASADAMLHLQVARVAPDALNMRAEPSLTAPAVTQFPEGTLLRPLGPARVADEVTWIQVRAAGGAQGWMSAKFLDIVAAVSADAAPAPGPARVQVPRPAQYRLTDSDVRLRERPGTGAGATVLATLNAGTVVDDDGADTAEAGGHTWRRVRTGGKTGWVATQFLAAVAGMQGAPGPAPVQLPRPPRYRLTDSGVRLRERPGTGAEVAVLTTLNSGTVVDDDGADTVNADGHVWRRVRVGGRTG